MYCHKDMSNLKNRKEVIKNVRVIYEDAGTYGEIQESEGNPAHSI